VNLYELMSGNLLASQSSSVFQFNTQPERNTSSGSDTSSFGAILSKLGGTERQTGVNPSRNTAAQKKAAGSDSVKSDDKPKYLTFQEANANVWKTDSSDAHVKTESAAEKTEKMPDDSTEDRKKDVKADMQSNFLNICAELLGIDKGELQKLLDKAGISMESLKDAAGIKEAAANLSQLLGLNSEQTESLKELFSMAAESLGMLEAKQPDGGSTDAGASAAKPAEVSKSSEVSKSADTQGIDSLQGVKTGSDESSADKSQLDKIAAKIGAKLDEISLQADKDNSTVEEELKNLMRPLLEKAEIAAKAVSQDGTQTAASDVQPADGDVSAQTQAANASDKDTGKGSSEEDDSDRESDDKTGQKAVVSQPAQTVKATTPLVQYQTVQDTRQAAAVVTEKTPEVPLKPSELINQVIEKAKVILSPDKSEMVMDLKPDSLGKLSLKVVTENGIVMAKFVADSQQVREILESNMQLLKDSLEKQGMNVQGFSVSVRQDQRGSDTSRPQYKSSGNPAGRTARNVSGTELQTAGIFESGAAGNPYRWEESTINLTA
jgi:flagellar hook-length control protein FliK